MSSTNTDPTILLDTGRSDSVWAVAFHPDGKHIFGGNEDGIRRWRLADGQEVGKQMEVTSVNAISVSRNHQWIVCGTYEGASVWDGEMEEKVIDMVGISIVDAVDVSPDSTRFATGTRAHEANIWSITSGQKLVGPLEHDRDVDGIRFSPSGDCIATACDTRIHIFDSHGGDELVTIKIDLPVTLVGITPLAWSIDGQQIFALSRDRKIRSFGASTGIQLAESQILPDGNDYVRSLALSANGKFIASFSAHSILFLDSSTLARIGPVVEDGERIRSVAISPDSSRFATGRSDGRIIIRDLGKILPDLCGPFNISTCDEVQQYEQPPTLGDHDGKEVRGEPSRGGSEGHSRDDDDLFELEARLSTPAEFDFDEPLSLASSAPEDEIPPVGSSHVVSQLSDAPAVTSIPEPLAQENLDTVASPHGRSIFKKWLQRKSYKDPTSHELNLLPGKSRRPGDRRSPSCSPSRVDAMNEGPSWMAAGKRKRRAVAKTVRRPQNKSAVKTTVPKPPNKDASRNGQVSAGANEASPPQQESNPSQPSSGTVHVTHQQETGVSTLSVSFPTWMWCCRSVSTQDGTH